MTIIRSFKKFNLTLISLLSISSINFVKVAPNWVMTSTTSVWGWFRLTVNLSLSQLCSKSLCWCKMSSGTFSECFERGLNPGRFSCKWLTLLYSTKNRWTWCDKPCTKLTNLALPLCPNCLKLIEVIILVRFQMSLNCDYNNSTLPNVTYLHNLAKTAEIAWARLCIARIVSLLFPAQKLPKWAWL